MGIQGFKWSKPLPKTDYERQIETLREMARRLKQSTQKSAEGS